MSSYRNYYLVELVGERGGEKRKLPTSTTPYPHYVLALAREIQESSLATDQSKFLATEEVSKFTACVNVCIILEFNVQLKFHAANGFMGTVIHAGLCAHVNFCCKNSYCGLYTR